MLVFETPDIYEKTMEHWASLPFEEVLKIQADLEFNSMYAIYQNNGELDNLPGDDIFLPLMLSPNSQIKIENYIFTLDFNEETVKAENDVEKSMDVFSFDHEVIPFLFDGAALEKGTYCDGQRNSSTVDGKECWTRYYRAGIYYSLYSQFDNDGTYGRMQTTENYKWKNRESNYYTYGNFNLYNNTNKLYYSMYKKRFRLKEYTSKVKFTISSNYTITNNCIK